MSRVPYILLAAAFGLSACQKASPPLEPAAKPEAKVQTTSRSEPVFYNGRQYQVSYAHNPATATFDVRVEGKSKPMKASDGAQAQSIASGVLRHFACPKDQTGRITGSPAFESGTWRMTARCGA